MFSRHTKHSQTQALAQTVPSGGRLTAAQYSTLEALVGRILPSDESAGAREANVVGFIRGLLHRKGFEQLPCRLAPGLDFLDALAQVRLGQPFWECREVSQDALLGEISRIPHRTLQDFLALAINLTLAGFLSHPRHGGNLGFVGWRFIGLDNQYPTSCQNGFRPNS